mmetsp:Transcript_33506/g.72530  ORF Transcript_33506/g.72530 Transcript_33506/m.72530 type:complete len:480 (+) Transcript_33506:137-1576(+)|eukprot:CAMPEP_0206466366 /NCGR_PEP_ID=MMETSP0324_2-20121206/28413_1 /ASSEMBLY_ACC=CAM_ASM_000836 /TAXON_ID=2866 /ORGANISM="Crypthecodinium cohnii, Strain Seligo" /LENGTH=479 /DNA_ID=CAMNT_0053939463 /DNA_START=71 /DNA_END=1510 /DNA_ORIENTATION=-
MPPRLIHWAAAAAVAVGLSSASDGSIDNITTEPYVAPEVPGLHFGETFDGGDIWSRWVNSKAAKYNGRFTVEKRKQEALVGDVGLLVPDEARHYGIAARFTPITGRKEAPFMVQYEVKLQDGLSCGGSYLKLFDSHNGADEFNDDTPYIIMFGPDRCGATDKVHFILKHKSPKTNVWEEKHFKDAPRVPADSHTHLYGLVLNPDNSFEVQIDGLVKASGNLLSSMEPPVNPAQEIDDPSDFKPAEWVDEAKIDDPSAFKPSDWDEDAPMMMDDPSASEPDGWVDDAPKKIDDPSASRPEDWDDDEDGEWEAPQIDNPACKVGCGEWKPPRISNPAYKGKWKAPKIDNPEYKGVWKPRKIANPDYFFDEAPAMLPTIDSVGIDIWTMTKGILFDNIVVSDDLEKVKAFTQATFKPRQKLEERQKPKIAKSQGFLETAKTLLSENLLAAGVTLLVLLSTTLWCCCAGSQKAPTEAEIRRLA